ncbi:DUF2330 domain-containing protein [Ornithinimicrobium sp. F0845]|uniref:DUF2330 domain-containing protein n=1 Tax=Ornithinimicrobium sp. F0845 TaxID=2926412 RepID=UPI001FF321D4|nr:DUF2330 domain-containing protein [Ornithinimicrobium sp. F0845]MCK0112456.1 DUF2330 domain-containing protein [Ornithinimicrobium sp. F0845]
MPTRTRAWIARATAAGVVGAALSVGASSAMACACGGMVGPDDASTVIGRETAVLQLHEGVETIHLQLSAHGTDSEAGLLLPTPAPAEVSLGNQQMFVDLFRASQPRHEERRHLFGPRWLFVGDGDGGGDGAGAPGDGGVNVLSVEDLGPLEATVLTADDPGALEAWLDERDYVMSEEFASVVQPYTDEGWAFVAVQLTAEGQALAGDLPPLEVSFPSEELVYPMRMSRAATSHQETRTYVLSGHRAERTDPTASSGSTPEVLFAGELDPDSLESAELRALVGSTPYLTTIDQGFSQPDRMITSDYTFAAAADDAPFQRVIYEDTYLIPIDVAIILGLLVLAAGAVLVVLVVRLTRRGRPA